MVCPAAFPQYIRKRRHFGITSGVGNQEMRTDAESLTMPARRTHSEMISEYEYSAHRWLFSRARPHAMEAEMRRFIWVTALFSILADPRLCVIGAGERHTRLPCDTAVARGSGLRESPFTEQLARTDLRDR